MTLCREERLRGKRVFANLFDNGHSFFQAPYKVCWIKVAEESLYPSRFTVSVSKRCFKRAVKRNLLKRRTRAIFRANKHILNNAISDGKQVHLIAIYQSDKVLPSSDLEDAMKKILQHIAQKYDEPV